MCYEHANCNNVPKESDKVGKNRENNGFIKLVIAKGMKSYYDRNVHEHTEKVYIEKEKV